MQTDDDDLITTAEALEVLGKSSATTISRYVTAGKLTPARKLPGLRGAYLFRRADVERLADPEAVAS